MRYLCGTEGSHINDLPQANESIPKGNGIINAGAALGVLFGIPCFFIALYGIAGVLTGEKMIAGFFGAMWGSMAVLGAYELMRRKFRWVRGAGHSDRNLLAGTLAVSLGLIISGAFHETMPALAIIPALSAIKQASDGHENRTLSLVHAVILVAGICIGTWFFIDGIIGKVWIERIVAMR